VIAPKKLETEGNLDAAQIQPVVERLQKMIAEYVGPAKSMHLKIQGKDILRVLDEAVLLVEEPERKAFFGERPEDYFLDGLYEELIQQPGAIFEKKFDEEGREYFAPLSGEIWLACLKKLREVISRGVG